MYKLIKLFYPESLNNTPILLRFSEELVGFPCYMLKHERKLLVCMSYFLMTHLENTFLFCMWKSKLC